MIEGLRPYQDMKASGVEWLPALPYSWEIHRAKYSFHEADDRSAAGDEELLSVSHKTGVTPRSQKNITMFMAESYEGHKVCRPGDVVVNTMWAWMAAIGVSRQVGIVSPAYGIYRPRTADRFEPKFLDYLLRTEVYRAEYLRSSRGITSSRLRLYPPDFLNIPFVQPPLDEQRMIVRFLDRHGAQAARLIRAKKKIMMLLSEQRQALVHRAVTRGLDEKTKLKPSGVPSFGDVPESWRLTRIKVLLREKSVKGFPDESPLAATQTMGVVKKSTYDKRTVLALKDLHLLKLVEVGEFVISLRSFQGGIEYARDRGIISPAYTVLECRDPLFHSYLALVFKSKPFIEVLTQSVTGIREGQNINYEQLSRFALPLPSAEEANAIVAFVNTATKEIDEALGFISREVALIQEFQAGFIADVVTGKLDVRAAAASLPEITEIEPIDDLVEDDDLDEAIDDAEDEEVAA